VSAARVQNEIREFLSIFDNKYPGARPVLYDEWLAKPLGEPLAEAGSGRRPPHQNPTWRLLPDASEPVSLLR
jgi:hypothetical protein